MIRRISSFHCHLMGLSGSESAPRAPSSCTTPPGGRPGTIDTMKTNDNLSVTASPRGGVESNVMGTRSTATKVNVIRRTCLASLRLIGEARETAQAVSNVPRPRHGGRGAGMCVVDGSRSGRGDADEEGRALRTGHPRRCRRAVRAAVVAQASHGKTKAGESGTMERSRPITGGAKGGRKWKYGKARVLSKHCYRLPTGLERQDQKVTGNVVGSMLYRRPQGPRDSPGIAWVALCRYPVKGPQGLNPVRSTTGEPCAGDPHARFGGGSGANQCAVPTSIKVEEPA